MGYIYGEDRDQMVMFPEVLDNYITKENPVRFVAEFVGSLDLKKLGFRRAEAKQRGRNAYQPGMLLGLYIYGYLNRIRSSRRLERECQRNVELMWLMRKLTPDHKTIADFRKDNLEPIKRVCREFQYFCKEMNLFGGELIAVDGSKFRAASSKERTFNREKVERARKRVEQEIEDYLRELDEGDEQEKDVRSPTAEELKEKIEELKRRLQKYDRIKEQVKESADGQVSLTDSDSRLMKSRQGTHAGYNVQAAIDSKHKLIVAHDVTNARSDRGQLTNISMQAKEVLGVENLEAIADMGYYDCRDVKRCETESITAYVQKPALSRKRALITKEDFTYDSERDVYLCPAGVELRYATNDKQRGREMRHYYNVEGCRSCSVKRQCTKAGYRRIKRLKDEGVMEAMAERVRGQPEKLALRKKLAEHPFGTIKRTMDQGYFLMRSKAKVGTEMSLTALAYNMRRVINIMGVNKMIKVLG